MDKQIDTLMDKQYDHQAHEAQMRQLWEQERVYHPNNNPGKLYSIDTPPPTVSGKLHIGHLFSYTQTDIIARYKRMCGFSVFYPFGFDDNGLPTERFVEERKEVKAYQMGRSAFIDLCLQETETVEQEFKQLWQTIGLSVEWEFWYSTISAQTRKLSQASFLDLYKKGFVYRKDEPALYCTFCRTSVAQAELDDKETPSTFNNIVFKDAQGNDLIIGTTRPELLPSCVALLYNPQDSRYQHLKGSDAHVPLFNFTVPILEDEHVAIDKGTGLVMCCTFGDKTDIVWYKKFNLPYKQSVGLNGVWLEHTGFLAGLKAGEARKRVLEKLAAENLLREQRAITHAVNVHERCKKEIEFVIIGQWFVNILDHKKTFIELADKINWYPHFMKSRYIDWVENLGWDWCISRQRFFGIPFPVWHCNACNHHVLADETQLPVDPQETAAPSICPQCSSTDLRADTDVMDTWNTSSITPYVCYQLLHPDAHNPFAEKKAPEFLPMSMRPQAHDIIRTWAFDTIVKSWMHHGIIPWNDIVISGHVLSTEKEKISKSRGNAPLDPKNILSQFPADAVRYWTASGGLGQDVAFSEAQIKIGIRLLTKLWNAFRFIGEHIQTVDPSQKPAHLGTVNEWIIDAASSCFAQYHHYFEKHEFSLALQQADQFFWNALCDNYLELIKHQLFNPHEYKTEEVEATRWTLHYIGLRILQLYAPYIPHMTDSLYQRLYRDSQKAISLHQTRFIDTIEMMRFEESSVLMNKIVDLVSHVRRLKTEKQLSLKVPLSALTIALADETLVSKLEHLEQVIRGVTHAVTINYTCSTMHSSLEQREDQWHAVVQLT